MSSSPRHPSYPLDAVCHRERWALDALRSRLAAAASEHGIAREHQGHVVQALRAATESTTLTAGAVIDPDRAARRLRHIRALQTVLDQAAQAVDTLGAACDGLRLAVKDQHVRLESIERHRQTFLRQAACDAERRQAIETEREWLARSAWTARSARGRAGATATVRCTAGDRLP